MKVEDEAKALETALTPQKKMVVDVNNNWFTPFSFNVMYIYWLGIYISLIL
jgi:hypothetical protein